MGGGGGGWGCVCMSSPYILMYMGVFIWTTCGHINSLTQSKTLTRKTSYMYCYTRALSGTLESWSPCPSINVLLNALGMT